MAKAITTKTPSSGSFFRWLDKTLGDIILYTAKTLLKGIELTARTAVSAGVALVIGAWETAAAPIKNYLATRKEIKELIRLAVSFGTTTAEAKSGLERLKSATSYKFLFKNPEGRALLDIVKTQAKTHRDGKILLQDVKSLANSHHTKMILDNLDKLSAVFGSRNNVPVGTIASSYAADVICKNAKNLGKMTHNLSLNHKLDITSNIAASANPKAILNQHRFIDKLAQIKPEIAVGITKLPANKFEAICKYKGAAQSFLKANGYSSEALNFLGNISPRETTLFLKNYNSLAKAATGSKNLSLSAAQDLVNSPNFATITEAASGFWEASIKTRVNLKSVLRHLEPSDRIAGFRALISAEPEIVDTLLSKENIRTFAKEISNTPKAERLEKFKGIVKDGLPAKQQAQAPESQRQTPSSDSPPDVATTVSGPPPKPVLGGYTAALAESRGVTPVVVIAPPSSRGMPSLMSRGGEPSFTANLGTDRSSLNATQRVLARIIAEQMGQGAGLN